MKKISLFFAMLFVVNSLMAQDEAIPVRINAGVRESYIKPYIFEGFNVDLAVKPMGGFGLGLSYVSNEGRTDDSSFCLQRWSAGFVLERVIPISLNHRLFIGGQLYLSTERDIKRLYRTDEQSPTFFQREQHSGLLGRFEADFFSLGNGCKQLLRSQSLRLSAGYNFGQIARFNGGVNTEIICLPIAKGLAGITFGLDIEAGNNFGQLSSRPGINVSADISLKNLAKYATAAKIKVGWQKWDNNGMVSLGINLDLSQVYYLGAYIQ